MSAVNPYNDFNETQWRIKATERRRNPRLPKAGLKCVQCFATDTPEWRSGPSGPRTLCNGCGLRYAKQVKREKEMKVKEELLAKRTSDLYKMKLNYILNLVPNE